MRLSAKARYAVTAMADLAIQKGMKPTPLAAIATRQDLPLPYLEQLFGKLRKAGLVTSSRGTTGGYRLARQCEALPIIDIIQAIEPPLKATRCDNNGSGCAKDGQLCLTHDLWNELSAVVQTFLTTTTLADIRDKRVAGIGRFNLPTPTSAGAIAC